MADLTLDEMLARFGIDPNDHILGLSEFINYLKDNPWILKDSDKGADLFANKLLDALNLDYEELEAAVAHRKEYDRCQKH